MKFYPHPPQGILLVCANRVKKNTRLSWLTALSAFFIGTSLMSSPAVARDQLNYKCDSTCISDSAGPSIGASGVVDNHSIILAKAQPTPEPTPAPSVTTPPQAETTCVTWLWGALYTGVVELCGA